MSPNTYIGRTRPVDKDTSTDTSKRTGFSIMKTSRSELTPAFISFKYNGVLWIGVGRNIRLQKTISDSAHPSPGTSARWCHLLEPFAAMSISNHTGPHLYQDHCH